MTGNKGVKDLAVEIMSVDTSPYQPQALALEPNSRGKESARKTDQKTEKIGGYDCEFITRPPDALQADCPVCLQVLREPNQATCCGYSFCRTCIERVQASKGSCPTCSQAVFTVFPDKRLQRSLNQFRVKCTHEKEGCDWTGELGSLESHFKSDCPCEVVDCDFLYAGCEVRLPRRDVPVHIAENLPSHFSLMGVHGRKTTQRIAQLEQENQELKTSLSSVRPYVPLFPINLVMTGFSQRSRADEVWMSEPFYTHPFGYKLRLKVYPNGAGLSKGTHLAIYGFLVRGEFDDHLPWPLRAHVVVQLLNQIGNKTHQELTITFSESTDPKLVGRVMTGELASMGRGNNSFLPIAELDLDSSKERQYLKDDCLRFQVARVFNLEYTGSIERGLRTIERKYLSLESQTFKSAAPVELLLTDFKQLKFYSDEWYSPPFYSHPKGYKLCLNVYANGWGGGKGTHISVFVYLMRGEFDEGLKWPFRGDVTLQLLNQLEDAVHHSWVVDFPSSVNVTITGRVTSGVRAASGRGNARFISHSQLGLNSSNNCQYLKNDCLCLKIAKVELKN